MGNEIVSKKTVAQFVHDVAEMETAIYTLDRMIERERKDHHTRVMNNSQRISEIERELHTQEKELEAEKSRRKINRSFLGRINNIVDDIFDALYDIWECYLKYVLLVFGVGLIPLIFISGLIFESLNLTWNQFLWGAGIIAGIVFVIVPLILFVVFIKQSCSTDKEFNNKNDNEYRLLQKKVESTQNTLLSLKDRSKELDIAGKLIEQQIITTKSNCMIIKNALLELYAFNIIPPDYRYMDCVIILDQIFRNDLADTMREAIKIYEERVFRGSVIRGMDKIVSMLGRLSSDMSAISLKLDMINNNVAHMSNDLNRFNERIASESAKNRAVTEDLIRETQLGRYTNEKLLESNKRLEYYAEEYRMGRMLIK